MESDVQLSAHTLAALQEFLAEQAQARLSHEESPVEEEEHITEEESEEHNAIEEVHSLVLVSSLIVTLQPPLENIDLLRGKTSLSPPYHACINEASQYV